MILKNILLFLIVCGLAGVCIFFGSVLGHSLGKFGLFSGAAIGGIVGIAIAVWLAARFALLDRANSGVTFLGAVIGFIIAAVIAVNNLHGPLIPMASVGLTGLGALIGKMLGRKRAA
jgi:hypothetical protein